MAVRVARVADVPVHDTPVDGLEWHPVRHHLGIRAFGSNAYVGRAVGDLVIEPHREGRPEEGPPGQGRRRDAGGEDSPHEELYVVLHGAARFEVDGEPVEAPQGTLVFVTPPSHRVATALEPQTTVLVVGGTPGEAFAVSEWERRWRGERA
jgi:hypothetical protein